MKGRLVPHCGSSAHECCAPCTDYVCGIPARHRFLIDELLPLPPHREGKFPSSKNRNARSIGALAEEIHNTVLVGGRIGGSG